MTKRQAFLSLGQGPWDKLQGGEVSAIWHATQGGLQKQDAKIPVFQNWPKMTQVVNNGPIMVGNGW